MNEWITNTSPKPGIIVLSCEDKSSRIIAASVLTLVGKGCKTTPSSCLAVSARWEKCFGLDPVSYIDMARPPRGGCRPRGPWVFCCPLGVCHRRVVFSVCRVLNCREQNIFQCNSSWGGADLLTKARPAINNRVECSNASRRKEIIQWAGSSSPLFCF